MSPLEKFALAPYQRAFVDEFLRPSSQRAHVLITQAGQGSGACVVEIVSRLVSERPDARVLILTEFNILLQQWMHRLDEIPASRQILEGSRHNLWEVAEGKRPLQLSWPSSITVVMVSRTLERIQEIRASVANTTWDLIVWDGFPPTTGHRVELLKELEADRNVKRILAISRSGNLNWGGAFPEFRHTVWDWPLLLEDSSAHDAAQITSILLTFQWTQKEAELRERLKELARRWSADSLPKSIVSRMMRAADSSPLALEQYLRQIRLTKLAIVMGDIPLEEQLEQTDSDREQDEYSYQRTSLLPYSDEILRIQESLDDLSEDSKLEALLKYVEDKRFIQTHSLIWCNYAATAQYLDAALADLNRESFVMVSGARASDCLTVLEDFERKGGILIATPAAMQGLECSAEMVVLYDIFPLPLQKALGFALRSAIAGKAATVVSVAEESEAHSSSRDLLGLF